MGQEVFDSQRAGGYSPLDFPLSGGLCWASWVQGEKGVHGLLLSLGRGGAGGLVTDQIRIRNAGKRVPVEREVGGSR